MPQPCPTAALPDLQAFLERGSTALLTALLQQPCPVHCFSSFCHRGGNGKKKGNPAQPAAFPSLNCSYCSCLSPNHSSLKEISPYPWPLHRKGRRKHRHRSGNVYLHHSESPHKAEKSIPHELMESNYFIWLSWSPAWRIKTRLARLPCSEHTQLQWINIELK